MMNFLKNFKVRAVLTVLTVLMLLFIFGMSAFNGDESSELSGGLLEYINSVLSLLGLGDILTEHILRKTAHYTEYFILGGLFVLDGLSYIGNFRKSIKFTLSAGLITACLDEFSQSFSEGRTPGVTDVIIDFSGILSAALIGCAVYIALKKKRPVFKD